MGNKWNLINQLILRDAKRDGRNYGNATIRQNYQAVWILPYFWAKRRCGYVRILVNGKTVDGPLCAVTKIGLHADNADGVQPIGV